MSLKSPVQIHVLSRIAKSDGVAELGKLLRQLEAGKLNARQFKSGLNKIFPGGLKRNDSAFAETLRLARIAHRSQKPQNPQQQQTLDDTIYQRALNLTHLADYQERGTQYVQVRAILDDKTTPQCVQMNGRVFAVGELARNVPNQVRVVRDNDYWDNADYFTGVPTAAIAADLPPYHYNCRTRVVPYIYAQEYQNFAKVQPDSKIYPYVLRDKIMNYDLDSSHLPALREYALASRWQPGIKSKAHQRSAFLDILNNPEAVFFLRQYRYQFQLWAGIQDGENWELALLDLMKHTGNGTMNLSSATLSKFTDTKDPNHKYLVLNPKGIPR